MNRHQRHLAALVVVAAGLAVVVHGSSVTPVHAAASKDPTCNTMVNGTPARSIGQSATDYVLNVGGASELGTVYDPPGNPQLGFPGISGADAVAADGSLVRRLVAQFSLAMDQADAEVSYGLLTSQDGGRSWPASTYRTVPSDGQPPGGFIRLRDGTLYAIGFVPVSTGGTTSTFPVARSTDDGATWSTSTAVMDFALGQNPGGRTGGALLELPDGTILVSAYGGFNATANSQAVLMASTDGGRTFLRRSIIAEQDAKNIYTEAGVAQLPNGNLLAVVRHQAPGNVLLTPSYTTSGDGGVEWAPLKPLKVSFPYGYDPFDDDAKTLLGISPQLMLMPNGVMVLRSGRPDNWVAISTNGQGTGWVGQLTYRNCPSDGYRFHGSTGNGGIAYRSANRMIVVGDNCELTWACNKTAETDFTVDKQNRIWRRFADVLTPDVGRIDLATKYRQGTVTVSGNMADTVAGHPRARVDGAFDGSTEYWSSAVHVGGPGSYVLKLDRTYPLTKVGLSLRNGRVATGRVYTSMDGITWSSAPVASAVNRTHLAMEYFTFTAPVPARYVKVEVDASPRCEAGLGSSCAFLNELELYSTIDSFENDPAGNRPRGFRNLVLSWVSQAESAGNDSAWALRVVDNDPNQQARASWIGAASATKTLEFRVKPTALAHSFLFDVLGRTSAGDQVAAYHFAATSAGVLRWYDGSAWHNLTGAGVVRVGTWQTIRVTATLTSASVSVNGTTVASGIARSRVAASLVGYTFASDGTTSTGDDVYFDDVLFSS